jgi:hypothetical protein
MRMIAVLAVLLVDAAGRLLLPSSASCLSSAASALEVAEATLGQANLSGLRGPGLALVVRLLPRQVPAIAETANKRTALAQLPCPSRY